MKAVYKVSDKVSFEIEGSNQKDIFEQLAKIDEVFGHSDCPITESGKSSSNIKFVVREDKDGNKYYELRCKEKPYARMAFGQHRSTKTLFPKRQEEGEYAGKYWFVWKPET